ncbi:outer membrane putative beta-barrel porin/alpha-amylase [Tenacibaculum lutimaris]|uniref:Outer membrane putative beta-barrel porin/alpha-amylase n=1 Tax=Tenacibaculum lutimaris TaxID=285258 RepID=A0A420DZD6_9FLAO|nr:transporter [Tenacibaculum lutimaris]RKF03201.1 outer membrane putative beta-barrel porin/alpha-amylase [Tenacibaculum lutimaris]
MIKKLLLFFVFFSVLTANAQYTPVINSNRPGFSESPYSVGSGVYQFESSIFYRKINATPTFSNPEALGLNLFFRTSFISEKLEVNLNTSLQKDKIAFKNIFESSYNKTGLSHFSIGAKYLIYAPKYDDKSKEIRSWKARHSFDWKRWIPHIGISAGLNIGDFLTDYHKRDGFSPRVGLLLQNEFSDKLNVITNLHYDYIGTDFSQLSYIVTGTYNFNDYWSGFAEIQGIFEEYEKKTNIGAGAAYLFSENLQFNASLRANMKQDEIGLYTSLGVSYRLNRHQDKFVEIDEFGNKIEEEKQVKYDEDRNFFGRMFSKVGKLFSKKREQKVDLDISKNTDDDVLNQKPRRERQGSLVDVIAKEDKKLKKKTAKEEKKAAKKAQKKAEKEAKRKEKERLKLEKQIKKEQEKEAKEKEKERLKLEKEIKKLEEEIKKEEQKEKEDQEKDDN